MLDRDQVAAQVDMFLKSEPDQLAFDPSLSAQERFLVHEVWHVDCVQRISEVQT